MSVSRGCSSFRNQSGLTLLELIVSIVVLGFAMAAIAAIFPLFQAADDIDDADRFARKAQGCAELIIACDQEDGENGFNTGVSSCGSGSIDDGDYEAIDNNNLGDFFDCGIDSDFVDDYCGETQVACAIYDEDTYFEISSEDGYQPIYFGIYSELD